MPAPKTADPISILVVEDEPAAAGLLVEVLVEAGHRVIGPVASADSAITLAAQTAPDLALIDIGLEGEADGYALAYRLRTTWGVPAVFATGGEVDAAHAGASPVLRKPYGEGDILAIVEAAPRR